MLGGLVLFKAVKETDFFLEGAPLPSTPFPIHNLNRPLFWLCITCAVAQSSFNKPRNSHSHTQVHTNFWIFAGRGLALWNTECSGKFSGFCEIVDFSTDGSNMHEASLTWTKSLPTKIGQSRISDTCSSEPPRNTVPPSWVVPVHNINSNRQAVAPGAGTIRGRKYLPHACYHHTQRPLSKSYRGL